MKQRQYPYFIYFNKPHFIIWWIVLWQKKCILADCSVLELYILVCMKRLEVKEQELCNFNSVMKGVVKFWFFFLFFYCLLWKSFLTHRYSFQSTKAYTIASKHLTFMHDLYVYGCVQLLTFKLFVHLKLKIILAHVKLIHHL